MAIQLGRLRPGPVRSNASAGPLPIPSFINVSTKGASVIVAITYRTDKGGEKRSRHAVTPQPVLDPVFGQNPPENADEKNPDEESGKMSLTNHQDSLRKLFISSAVNAFQAYTDATAVATSHTLTLYRYDPVCTM